MDVCVFVCSRITLERLERFQPHFVHILLYVCVRILCMFYVYIFIYIQYNRPLGCFRLCSLTDRAEFLLRSYEPGSGRASGTVLQSLCYTRTNLYFYLMELDTDYKAVYLRSGYFWRVRLDGSEVGVWVSLEKELSHLEIFQYPKSQKSPRLQTCIIGYFGIRGCPKALWPSK
jgi:hypothetical protein